MRNPFHTDPRLRWAKSIEQLLDESTRPVPPSMRRFLPIYCRAVVQACAGSLSEIAIALRDPRRSVSDSALRQVIVFLSHTDESPLYGDDPLPAKWAADKLSVALAGDTHQSPAGEELLV
jgi:hypothetical protein